MFDFFDDIIGVPIGTWNHVYVILGLRGTGKSTYCVDKAEDLAHGSGAYKIGHSLGARLPRALPDGTQVDIRYYASIDKLDKGLRRSPNAFHVLASGDADELLRYARDLSERIRRRAWRRAHGIFKPWSPMRDMTGIVAPPIVCVFDETVAMSMNLGRSGGRNVEARYFREAIYSARHEHIAYLFQIQDPNAMGPALMSQATNYVCFRLEHQWAKNAVEGAGCPPDELEEIGTLPDYEYVEFGAGVRNRDTATSREAPEPDTRTTSTPKRP